MLNVFKYDVEVGDYFKINLPQGAQILKVEEQHGYPRLWALVDPQKPIECREFRFAGTGHPITD